MSGTYKSWRAAIAAALLPTVVGLVVGCSQPSEPVSGTDPSPGTDEEMFRSMGTQPPPPGQVQVPLFGEDLMFWPYTGKSFDGTPSDPINLIFVGHADPVEIRAALLALDGDRSGAGLPPIPPFNLPWTDAIGDVQVGYAEDGGWMGSVVQLEFGGYEDIRFHVRLFATSAERGEGTVTLGAAHFEVQIPSTTDHQVLSWNLARDILVHDFMRSGLLDSEVPLFPSGPINDSPFRTIPAVIYNGLPIEIRMLIGGPLEDVTEDVPIASDGNAIVLNLAGREEPVVGEAYQVVSIDFDQVIPKPFCMDNELDWVYVTGRVDFDKSASIVPDGDYRYHSQYWGELTVVPVDITVNPPVPIGEPYQATVNGTQHGQHNPLMNAVRAIDRRVAPQEDGTELYTSWLRVGSRGLHAYRVRTHCLD